MKLSDDCAIPFVSSWCLDFHELRCIGDFSGIEFSAISCVGFPLQLGRPTGFLAMNDLNSPSQKRASILVGPDLFTE